MLNIAVMAPPGGVFSYQLLALKKLERVDGVNLSFIFHPYVDEAVAAKPRRLDLYKWWRKAFHLSEGRAPLEVKQMLSEVFPHIHPMALELENCGNHRYRLTPSSEELVSLLDLDALLNLHTFILSGRILEAFTHGAWSYHHGDPLEYRGTPPGFWELHDGAQRSGAMFQRLGERLDDGEVLREVDLPTVGHDYCAQRQALFAAGIDWPADVAREVMEHGRLSVKAQAGRSRCAIRRRPTNLDLLRFFVRYGKAKLRWQLGFCSR